MKKIVSMILVLAMIFGMTSTVFANEDRNTLNISKANRIADEINILGESENINSEMIKTNGSFRMIKEDVTFTLPESGNKDITLELKDKPEISVSLPNGSRYTKGALANDGTVVYDAYSRNYSVAVQAIEKDYGDLSFDELKTSIVMNNRNVPKKYSSEYKLPSGYTMLSISDYLETYATADERQAFSGIDDAIVILDENMEIDFTIDGLQAMDSQGNEVNTHFEVNGNLLTRVVEFDENTQFPIVLYDAAHPNYTRTTYLNAAEIKEVRDRYTGLGISPLVDFIINLGPSSVSNIYTFVEASVNLYDQYTYSTWNTFYVNVSTNPLYDYLRVITTYHYHPGQGTYFPIRCDYAYVSRIPA